MRRIAVINLAALCLLASPSAADPVRDAMRENIRLFDELVTCSRDPRFSEHGVSRAGPCGDWNDRVKEANERQTGRDILFAGGGCLAGELFTASNGLVFGDRERFDYVNELIDECREIVGR